MASRSLGSGIPALKAKETGKILDVTIDFSKTNQTAADVLSAAVAANVEITDVYSQVVAASTDSGTRTIGIGDTGTGATKWAAAVDMKTAGVLTKSGTAATLYTAADTFGITCNHNLTTGKLRVVAYGKIIG